MSTGKRPLEELADAIAAEEVASLVDSARSAALERAQATLEDAIYERLLHRAMRLGTPEPTAPRDEAEVQASGDVWWAYGVLSSDHDLAGLDELEGIEPGTPVRVVAQGELAALVSPVPLADYGDERLREHLEDIRWVERTARAHEAVLDAVLASTSIVPLRLCTLYRDLDGVRRALSTDGETFAAALRRIDGCQEWGVKVFADADAGAGAGAGGHGRPMDSDQRISGAGYLQSRRRQRDERRRAVEQRAAWVEEIHLELSAVARDATTNRPQRQELHGRQETMVLNGAYLVEQDRVADLEAVARELEERWSAHGLSLELTGPWPAYNFVSAETGVMP